MKGKINKDGTLLIARRRGGYKIQVCPWQSSQASTVYCGDECPMFGEPNEVVLGGDIALSLCEGMLLHFEELVDNRKVTE
jgi:hypothetical protein